VIAPLLARLVADRDDLRHSTALAEIVALDEAAAPGLRKAVTGASTELALAAVAALRIELTAPDRSWVVSVLRAALGASLPEVRGWAADALGFASLGGDVPAPVVELLRGALSDPSPLVRSYAAHALVRLDAVDGSPEIVAALVFGLTSERVDLAHGAVEGLGRLGPSAASAVPGLARILADPSPEETRGDSAAEALDRIGPTGVAALLDAVAIGGPRVKGHAFAAAWRRRPLLARLLPMAIADLADPDPRVRRQAAGAVGLAGIGRHDAAAALEKALRDPSPEVVQAVALALARLGPEAQAALPALLTIARQTKPSSVDLLTALGGMGPAAKDALPALRARLGEDPEAVAHALGRLGPAAIPTLVAALGHADPRVRHAAARALSYLGTDAAPAVRELARALHDPEASVRNAAAQALGAIGPAAAPAVSALVTRLADDPDANVRSWSASALGRIGPAAASALPALQKALGEARLAIEAARALAAVAGPGVAVPPLLALAEKNERYSGLTALAALGDLGPRAAAAAPSLVARLTASPAPSAETLPWAITLARIDGSPVAVAHLESALASPELRLSAAEALVRAGQAGPATLEVLRVARSSRRARERGRAAALLAQALPSDPEARGALLATLAEVDSQAVGEAVRVLAQGPVPAEAAPALTALLASVETWERRGAAQALGRLGTAGRPALPALRRLLFADDAEARAMALVAIEAVRGK